MKVLVTGSAGFIGFHLVNKLLERGHHVVGLDCINSYYEVCLKYGRLEQAGIRREAIQEGKLIESDRYANYRFVKEDLGSKDFLSTLFEEQQFDVVVNLAAQANVRYSLERPDAYISSNVMGFLNVLEACRYHPVKHLVYASSSSVYGTDANIPFSTSDPVERPISIYAASKKANELMAHTYSYLFGIPTTGLRFFTVYGPWGRPDMALFLFTKKILEGEPIQIFNNGNLKRDFTYIDDVVEGLVRVIDKSNSALPHTDAVPYRLYNIGNASPVRLTDFVDALEEALDREAIKEYLPMQPGDVEATWADVSDLKRDFGYQPKTELRKGIATFVAWYKEFYPKAVTL